MIYDNDANFFDYKDSMSQLFKLFKIKKILEFGLGEGTKFLLENNRKVTSVELQVFDLYCGWFDKIARDLINEKNWRGILYETTDQYLPDTEKMVKDIAKKGFDFAFVDPACHTRPLIVNSLMEVGVPIIAAHDTFAEYDNFSWSLANKEGNYHEIQLPTPKGITYYFKDKDKFIKFKENI